MKSDVSLLGGSLAFAQLRAEIATAARSAATVLIEGETGAGKELAARHIHDLGVRSDRRFVAINCAGLPDSLLESELFGHVRGSFTGAYRDKVGLAALADGGTLFFDELGEMPARMQALLLRFVETGEIHPVGADRAARHVNVRLIAATNRNLAERVAAGAFRSDLYYRLNVVRLRVPPLRERGADILTLMRHFLVLFAGVHQCPVPTLDAAVEQTLLRHPWPGNVRELRNVAEHLVVRRAARAIDTVQLADLPPEFGSACGVKRAEPPSGTHDVAHRCPRADQAWTAMLEGGESFWNVVYQVFMDRELTKSDLRYIVRRGLERANGSYRTMTELFHIAPGEYKRFLAFLYQHDCHIPLRVVRSDSARTDERRVGTRS